MLNFGFRRKKASDAATGGNDVLDISYNRYVGGLKMIPVQGQLTVLGSLAAAVALPDIGTLVAVFNPTAAPLYVKFGAAAVTAPTGGADGIAIPAGQYITLAAGNNTHIISNGAVFGYVIEDDTFLAPMPA